MKTYRVAYSCFDTMIKQLNSFLKIRRDFFERSTNDLLQFLPMNPKKSNNLNFCRITIKLMIKSYAVNFCKKTWWHNLINF